MADPDPDALRAVRARLDEAHAAADRLVREARTQAEGTDSPAESGVPPRGWESEPAGAGGSPDLKAVVALLALLRDTVPEEVTRPLATALRDLLLALRALIDWYLERFADPGPGRGGPDVEDIPLD